LEAQDARRGAARIAMVRDPDGNWIERSQRASIVARSPDGALTLRNRALRIRSDPAIRPKALYGNLMHRAAGSALA